MAGWVHRRTGEHTALSWFESPLAACLTLLILCGIFFFFRLGSFPLLGPDEPRYGQVAREMLTRLDVITPTLGGHPWLEKPVLLYWLMMLSMSLLGVTEWAARLPSALLAALATMIVYDTGRRVISAQYGFLSGLALSVSLMFAVFAHGATTDMPLAATMTLGLCCFFVFETRAARRPHRWLLAAYAWFGAALLAKGLVGVVLPLAIIGVYWLLTHQWKRWREARWLAGLLMLLAVASTWYVPVIARHGWTFINEFFISHHLERFTSNKFNHPGPIYYFIPVILIGVFPFTTFLVAALMRLRWSLCHSEDVRDRLRCFAAVWVFLPLLFFSFSGSKLPGYILPVIPAAAFLIADELQRLLTADVDRAGSVAAKLAAAFVMTMSVVGFFFAEKELPLSGKGHLIMLFIGLGTGAVALYWSVIHQCGRSIAALVVGCAVAFTAANFVYVPAAAEKESLHRLAEAAVRAMRPDERIVGFFYFHHSLTFYTNARSIYDERGNVVIARSPDELLQQARQHGSVLCVTRQEIWQDLSRDARFRFELLGRQQDIILVRATGQ